MAMIVAHEWYREHGKQKAAMRRRRMQRMRLFMNNGADKAPLADLRVAGS
jgi:hypothetical protein